MSDIALGRKKTASGNITRLNWVGARPPELIEKLLGFEPGRLSQGYWIGLLIERIRANHVEFGGLTTRSGGRLGLPEKNPVADWLRPKVHDQMLAEYSQAEMAAMLKKLSDDPRNLLGSERIVKVFPVTLHVGANPQQEYPAGGGGPQFRLTDGHDFLIAVEVTPHGIAKSAEGWSVRVDENAGYDGRAKLARYLETVTAP